MGEMIGGIWEGYGRDKGRDESLKAPLNKRFLLKNGRDDGKQVTIAKKR